MGRLIMPQSAGQRVPHPWPHAPYAPDRADAPLFRRSRDQAEERASRRAFSSPGAPASKLMRGGPLPQGWVRDPRRRIRLSDDALGPTLTLVGFGRDPRGGARAGHGARLRRLRRQDRPDRASRAGASLSPRRRCWEDLDGSFMPGAAPFGWAAVVRPDRTVLHDGPAADADRLVRESLSLLGAPAPAEAPRAPSPPFPL